MKILLIHQYFNVSTGGFRTYQFAKYLINNGHEVIVITSNRNNPKWNKVERKLVEKIDIIYIKNEYSNSLSYTRRIYSFLRFMLLSTIEALKQKKINLVYATSTPLTVGIPGMIFKKIKKVPFVFEVRDLWPEIPIEMGIIKNRLIILILKYIEKRIYFSSNHIIALSPGMKEGIAKTGYPKDNITLISNGCDLDLFNTNKSSNFHVEGIGKNDFTLIYAGNFGLANGLDYVIDIAKYLQTNGIKGFKFLLIGSGMKKVQLMNSIQKYSLTNIIIIDAVPKKELVKYFDHSSMGMQLLADYKCFQYGTSPNKFFDYLAAGKPVFNNYPGWVADMINENNNGIVIDRYDHKGTVEKLLELKNNPHLMKMMGVNSSKLAKASFDRNTLARRLEAVFLKLVK